VLFSLQNKLDGYEKQVVELNMLGEKMGTEFNEKVRMRKPNQQGKQVVVVVVDSSSSCRRRRKRRRSERGKKKSGSGTDACSISSPPSPLCVLDYRWSTRRSSSRSKGSSLLRVSHLSPPPPALLPLLLQPPPAQLFPPPPPPPSSPSISSVVLIVMIQTTPSSSPS